MATSERPGVPHAAVLAPVAPAAGDAPPTVIVDDVHVTYSVFGARRSGRRGFGLRGTRQVHALRGVSLVAHRGDSIGLVGRNGSGKSTLLRCIAGLIQPSSGAVYARSEPQLLGVNAALIRELSGERNVILGGLALGLSPREVRRRYESIVEFADLGEFMDLPLRAYSSGMAARLRFAVATSTSPEILLVDEALATGDAEFRERSEHRLREMHEQAGTVFLVSHSLSAIEHTCNRVVWLDRGQARMDGPVADVLDAYRVAASRARRRARQHRVGQARSPDGPPAEPPDGTANGQPDGAPAQPPDGTPAQPK